ncbi:hypothetical protein Zmor_027944 [Zophobas morio]|uniref:Uncharacterized protein n=1 Tax=Zophobas morio TaxID=2755281 RepID=A0AA38M3R9_9CUCU|nr:hypothetical protein Zmor_027944 [Zophobas morio]
MIYRRQQECDTEKQIENLKKDIYNCPKHVFGDHSSCDSYFCNSHKDDEENYVPEMIECGLMDDLQSCGARLLHNGHSLMLNMTNNAAETYNSVVSKFVGGKRQNFSIKNSYSKRCQAASLSYNKKEQYYSSVHKAVTLRSPGKFIKSYMARLSQSREKRKVRRQLFPTKKTEKIGPS